VRQQSAIDVRVGSLTKRPRTPSITSMSLRRLFFRHFNYALFVPESNRAILTTLAERGLPAMIAELERSSALGSVWASSALGYLSLLPSSSGTRNPQRAIELCARGAKDGDPYALFVTAWALYLLTENRVKAAEPMFQASQKRFSPATLAMAFFVWPNIQMALRFVDTAARLGHKAAWAWRCGFLRTGRLGPLNRLFGYTMTPFARLHYASALWITPFSEDVLLVTLTDQRPAYRTTVPTEHDSQC
jgi:TPR repeat protein